VGVEGEQFSTIPQLQFDHSSILEAIVSSDLSNDL
jgi:hypothetical protein